MILIQIFTIQEPEINKVLKQNHNTNYVFIV